MAKLESYNKKAAGSIIKEAYRELNNYTNKVDVNKSVKNYHYNQDLRDSKNMQVAINKRVNDIMQGRNIQDKTNIVSSWVVSLPKTFQGDSKDFFDTVYDFCKARYGADNVIDGVVHMDETNPHIHVFLVPEAISRKTKLNTVSSASKFTRAELSSFHTELDKVCSTRFNQKNLVRNGLTVQNGLDLKDFKAVMNMSDGFTDYLKTKVVNKANTLTANDMLNKWLADYNKTLENTVQTSQDVHTDDLVHKTSKSVVDAHKTTQATSQRPQERPEQKPIAIIPRTEQSCLDLDEELRSSRYQDDKLTDTERFVAEVHKMVSEGLNDLEFNKIDNSPLGGYSR